jgi:hypothetical protein
MIANKAVQVQRAVLAGDTEIAHMYIRDIVLKAAEIGTRGSMAKHLAARSSLGRNL